MKKQINNGLAFQKESIAELNSNSLKSINSGQDTLYRTTILRTLMDFIANGGATQE